jgi:hypothetical protein
MSALARCVLCNLTGWTTHIYYPNGHRVETPCARCNPGSTGKVFRELAYDRKHGQRLVSTSAKGTDGK